MMQKQKEQITIIKLSNKFVPIDFKELWKYHELFFFLAMRNISIRYKQTILGITWAGIQPLITMVIFTVIFGRIAKLDDGGVPYPLIAMTGVLPWQFFSVSVSQASSSIVGSANLVQKVYFPKIILPFSSILSSLIDFGISFAVFLLVFIYYGFSPTIHIVFLPLFLILLLITSLAVSLWFSSLNVAYRDVKIVVPFLLQLGLYISPVGFLTSNIPERYQFIYSLNPLVGILDGFRWCLLGGKFSPDWNGLIISTIVVGIILISGLFYFVKTEKTFADII